MLKTNAIELLGGSIAAAAKELGITYQAVYKWPDVLSGDMRDRVQAALYRKGRTTGKASRPAQKPVGEQA